MACSGVFIGENALGGKSLGSPTGNMLREAPIKSSVPDASDPSGAKAPDSIGSATYGLKPVPFKAYLIRGS